MSWRIGKVQLDYAPKLSKSIVKRQITKLGIVAGKPLFMDLGKSGEEWAIEGWVLTDRQYQLLKQQVDNGYFQPVYVYNCPERFEGYYYMEQQDLDQAPGIVGAYGYKFKLWRVGTRENLMEGVFASQGELSVDTGLTAFSGAGFRVIPLPMGAQHVLVDNTPLSGVDFTRDGVDGNDAHPCIYVTSGYESIVLYNQDLSDIYGGECKVFDTRGSGTESYWYEVLDDEHVFTGKLVVQNGLIRIRVPDSGAKIDHYIWTGTAWDDINIDFDTTGESAGPVSYAFNRLSREEIDVILRWANGIWRRYKFRRGQPFFEYSDIYTRGQRGSNYNLNMLWDTDYNQYVAWNYSTSSIYEQNSFASADVDLLLADGESYEITDIWFAIYKKSNPWAGQFVAMTRQPTDGKVTGSSNNITKIVLTWNAEPTLFFGYIRGNFTGTPPAILTAAGSDVSLKFRAHESMHEHNFTRRLNNRAWTVL